MRVKGKQGQANTEYLQRVRLPMSENMAVEKVGQVLTICHKLMMQFENHLFSIYPTEVQSTHILLSLTFTTMYQQLWRLNHYV